MPFTVTVYVPVAVPLGTVTVISDEPESVIDVGSKVALNPPVDV